MMEFWCRQYHGETCDPRWIGIARAAGNGVTPGHVAAIWFALKECAAKARPRGAVGAFDAEAISDFFGWPADQVRAVYLAIEARGIIVDGIIHEWPERQPVRFDATNATRQKRHREKKKAAVSGSPAAPDVTDSNGRYAPLPVTRNTVTPTEEKEQSKSSFSDASKQASDTSLKLDTSRTVRERAGAIISVSDFWTWITAQGLPAHLGIRTLNRGRLAEWIEQGLTEADLAESMKRARQSRQQQHSPHPVNIGFLACFVDEVLSGAQPTTSTGGGYGRGDQLSREFADVR